VQKFKVYFWKWLPSKIFKDIKTKYRNRLNDYMNVYICEDFKEMYDIVDKVEKQKQERDYAGRTFCIDKNCYEVETGKFVKTYPCCGYMYFNKNHFYMDTISHESTHAVIGYFNRKLKDMQNIFTLIENEKIINEDETDLNEELFCYMVGNIGDQIVSKQEE